jgi:hypothetical protein
MNLIFLNQLLRSKSIIYVNSFFIAFFMWSHLSSWRILEISKYITLSFYSLNAVIENYQQNIMITLRGPRSALKNLDWTSLKAHINVDKLPDIHAPFVLKAEHLYLPNTIKLINSNPSLLFLDLMKRN